MLAVCTLVLALVLATALADRSSHLVIRETAPALAAVPLASGRGLIAPAHIAVPARPALVLLVLLGLLIRLALLAVLRLRILRMLLVLLRRNVLVLLRLNVLVLLRLIVLMLLRRNLLVLLMLRRMLWFWMAVPWRRRVLVTAVAPLVTAAVTSRIVLH